MTNFILELNLNGKIKDVNDFFKEKPEFVINIKNQGFEFLSWGDPIKGDNFDKQQCEVCNPVFIINNLYGHYYFLLYNKNSREIILGNSLFSILPIYIVSQNGKIFCSNNALKLAAHIGLNQISKRFILEQILFNYQLFNNSIIEGIKLLSSNHCLVINDNKYTEIKHLNIEKYFASKPIPWRKSLTKMSDLFLERIQTYFPSTAFYISLTGGFDGRTLVSSALKNRMDFSCYSFGSKVSRDINIAQNIADKYGIQYKKLALEKEYAKKHSLPNGMEFIYNSSGNASFSRAHYLYAAKELSKQHNYILTGNFGSEIFRAAHNAGVMFSQNLISLFSKQRFSEIIQTVENSANFSYLNRANFKQEWNELKEELIDLPPFNPEYKSLTQNQRFYVFVFEEVFRKYFGAEMSNQFNYIKNRTPFLDIGFLKEILSTGLAGIHSEFFEHNPLKRYKGQLLYAHIISKAYPPFGKELTDKGYCPDDLINPFGKIKIVRSYIRKRFNKQITNHDPYGVHTSYLTNIESYKKIYINPDLFNKEQFGDNSYHNINEIRAKAISLSYTSQIIADY